MHELGLQHFTRLDPEAIAVIDTTGTWSRERLAAQVNRTAKVLIEAGLSPGDTIAVVAPNSAETLAAYLAAIEAGLYVVPVNWHLADEELAFVLEDSGARMVIAHERLGAVRLAALRARHGTRRRTLCIGRAGGVEHGFEHFGALASRHSPCPVSGLPRGRVMAYTSATTGRPKAVRLPLANAENALRRMVEWQIALGIEPQDGNVHLCASMLYHCAPLEGALVAQHMGHTVVLVERWEPEALLQLIERHRVTTTFMVPSMFIRLLKLPDPVRGRYSTASLRFVIHGGAPCPVDVKRRMIEWWGPIVWEAYGAAEAQGTIVGAREWLEFPGTVGTPSPGSAIRILDDAGRELPPGEAGLVYMRPGSGDRFEYKGDPGKTASSYHGDFVTVGDIGYLNERGFLFLCDRRADLILSSGMNIYPAEIEQVLVQHPAVADCAVIGEPHELFGEVPKAVVEPVHGASPCPQLTRQLLQFLSTRLSPMKMPKRIEYIHAIPRDPSGKLYRRLLRQPPHRHPAAAQPGADE